MRDIKFRLWINEYKDFMYWGFTSDNCFTSIPQSAGMNLKKAQKMSNQYIGLKDKNGKEIYENDVVNFHFFYFDGNFDAEKEFKAVVKIYPLGVYLESKEKDGEGENYSNYPINFYGFHEESFEIIGNIYENPELLNKGG